eukprot:Opistho-2@4943
MAETTRFVPEWMKTGSSGTGSPNSKSFSFGAGVSTNGFAALSDDGGVNRYSRDELLALFVKSAPIPEPMKEHVAILSVEMQPPMALIPLTEDEERSMSSIARAPPRGAVASRGRGAPVRGRGRGRGDERGAYGDQAVGLRDWSQDRAPERGLDRLQSDPFARRPKGADEWRSSAPGGFGRGKESERSWRRHGDDDHGDHEEPAESLWDDPNTGAVGEFDGSGVFRELPRRRDERSAASSSATTPATRSLDVSHNSVTSMGTPHQHDQHSSSQSSIRGHMEVPQRQRLPSDSLDEPLSVESDPNNVAISAFLQLSLDQQAANERELSLGDPTQPTQPTPA